VEFFQTIAERDALHTRTLRHHNTSNGVKWNYISIAAEERRAANICQETVPQNESAER
jgi:hypothetical protein